MPPIKTIIFDIGGVLLNIHPEKTFKFWANITGLSLNKLQKSIPWDLHSLYETGKLDDFQFYSAVNNLLPKDNKISVEDFWYGWKLLLGNETPAVDLLESLYKTIPVWLLSNTNPWHVGFLQSSNEYRFHQLIKGAIYSYEVGYRKPDMNIYTLTLDRIGISGRNVVFIDDNEDNVSAARTLGMNAVVYEGVQKLIESLEKFKIPINNSVLI